MIEENDIKAFSRNIYSNRAEHEQNIKGLLVKSVVCSKEDFFARCQEQMQNIESEISGSGEELSIDHYKKIFQAFDKYPANIQKRKKPAPKDPNRTLAGCKAQSLNDITCVSTVTVNNHINWETGPTASDVYKEFRQFRQNLTKYMEKFDDKDLEKEYVKNLQKLNTLAKEVEKLYPTDSRVVEEAFNEEQKETLRQFVANMESGLNVDSNRNLFKEGNDSMADTESLESVIELLSYWLNSVAQFNEI